jgi:hypothetical protein
MILIFQRKYNTFKIKSVSTPWWKAKESWNRIESDRKAQFAKYIMFIMLRLWTMEEDNFENLIDCEVGTNGSYVRYYLNISSPMF